MSQKLGHTLSQTVKQILEQLERFRFILIERIPLRIASKSNNRPQMLQRQQMLTPLAINGFKQNLLFNHPHILRSKLNRLAGHEFVTQVFKLFADRVVIRSLLRRPVHHWRINP